MHVCNIDTSINYLVEIETQNNESIKCNIKDKIESNSESNVHISLFQGLPKSDKMEYIIQKNVELGIYDITPVEMKRCVIKLDEKSKNKKIERWQKISETAAKQSGRDIVPKVNNVINVKNICNLINKYDIVLLAYEEEVENILKEELNKIQKDTNNNIKMGIIIGPEGGIEQEEVRLLKDNGAKTITLGKRILRTETASVVLTSIIMYELDGSR